MSIEPVDRESGSGARRTKTIFQPKEMVVDVLKKKYKLIAKLNPPQYGWAEFRDWIDSTRIAIEHSFGKGSDQEREFMRIEYAPQMDGYAILKASPHQPIGILTNISEGLTKARLCLVNIMEEVVYFCKEDEGVGLRKKSGKLKIMVSSAVYGYQEFLDRIYDLLVALGYEVWMSHKGTIPVVSTCDTLENCMHGVEQCDLFLGIITGQYGKTIRDGFSATHLEFKRAIELNKPRWFIVDDRVIFARRFLNGLYQDSTCNVKLDRNNLYFKGDPTFSDLRLIDMYELARERKSERDDVKWVQEYRDDNSALLFAMAQFGRYLEIEDLLKKRLVDVDGIRSLIASKEA